MIRDFQKECNTFIDVDEQIKFDNMNEIEFDEEEM